jgi:hypothetical protein
VCFRHAGVHRARLPGASLPCVKRRLSSHARRGQLALEQLDLWPADNERGLYLLARLADAFEAAAAQVDVEGAPLRQGACGASAVGVVDLDVGDVVAHVGGSRRRHR